MTAVQRHYFQDAAIPITRELAGMPFLTGGIWAQWAQEYAEDS